MKLKKNTIQRAKRVIPLLPRQHFLHTSFTAKQNGNDGCRRFHELKIDACKKKGRLPYIVLLTASKNKIRIGRSSVSTETRAIERRMHRVRVSGKEMYSCRIRDSPYAVVKMVEISFAHRCCCGLLDRLIIVVKYILLGVLASFFNWREVDLIKKRDIVFKIVGGWIDETVEAGAHGTMADFVKGHSFPIRSKSYEISDTVHHVEHLERKNKLWKIMEQTSVKNSFSKIGPSCVAFSGIFLGYIMICWIRKNGLNAHLSYQTVASYPKWLSKYFLSWIVLLPGGAHMSMGFVVTERKARPLQQTTARNTPKRVVRYDCRVMN